MAAVKDKTAGWVQVESHDRLSIGAKTYRNMVVWQRACTVCSEAFTVPLKDGDVTNNSFGYRTCKAHRGMKPGEISGDEALKKELAEVKAELTAAYNVSMDHMQEKGEIARKYQAAFAELQVLKAKLAKYELQPAMEAAKNNSTIFPWGD